jgi:hypothetical protein
MNQVGADYHCVPKQQRRKTIDNPPVMQQADQAEYVSSRCIHYGAAVVPETLGFF